jgi:hypothetical protein
VTERDEDSGDHSEDESPAVAGACAECGAELQPDQAFCTSCGTPVPSATGAAGNDGSGGGLDSGQKRALGIGAAVVGVIIVIVAVTSGGGGDDSAVEAAPPTTEESVVTTEPTTTTTTIPVGEAGTWVVSGSDDRGYSSRVSLAIGTPRHADPAEEESGSYYDPDLEEYVAEKVIKACAVTKATDAIVPVELTVENTTSNFPEILGMVLYVDSYPGGAVSVQSDVEFTSGPECQDPGDYDDEKLWGFQVTEAIDPATSTQRTGFLLVLHNYYSPAYPDGDVASYESLRLAPELTFGDTFGDDERRVKGVTIGRLGSPSAPSFQLVASDDGF